VGNGNASVHTSDKRDCELSKSALSSNFVLVFSCSSLASLIYVTRPFDVPKTNIQARYDTKVFGSYFPEFIQIARQRGIAGLYSGLLPTLVRAFPANAALFLGVESTKKVFDRYLWPE